MIEIVGILVVAQLVLQLRSILDLQLAPNPLG
jgi:hypothetical protein